MNTTTQALAPLTGALALFNVEGLGVQVRIIDTKTAYGNRRALIVPEMGEGTKWVDMSRLIVISEGN